MFSLGTADFALIEAPLGEGGAGAGQQAVQEVVPSSRSSTKFTDTGYLTKSGSGPMEKN